MYCHDQVTRWKHKEDIANLSVDADAVYYCDGETNLPTSQPLLPLPSLHIRDRQQDSHTQFCQIQLIITMATGRKKCSPSNIKSSLSSIYVIIKPMENECGYHIYHFEKFTCQLWALSFWTREYYMYHITPRLQKEMQVRHAGWTENITEEMASLFPQISWQKEDSWELEQTVALQNIFFLNRTVV